MTTDGQRTALKAGIGLMLAAFVVQPKTNSGGYPLGYHLFFSNVDKGNGQTAWQDLWPDYKMLAVEFVIIVFVTLCWYLLGAARKE